MIPSRFSLTNRCLRRSEGRLTRGLRRERPALTADGRRHTTSRGPFSEGQGPGPSGTPPSGEPSDGAGSRAEESSSASRRILPRTDAEHAGSALAEEARQAIADTHGHRKSPRSHETPANEAVPHEK